MRIAVRVLIGLVGLTAVITGAYIRSCAMTETPFTRTWCGKPPPGALTLASQGHCAGCVLAAAGFAMVLASLAMAALSGRRRAIAREPS